MPIRISIIDDFSSIFRGTKRLGDAFDEVADAVDDLADESQDAGRKIERSFADAFQEVRRDSKRMADDVADDTRRSITGRGGEAVAEFRDEARQNFSEVASSFSGGIDSAADLVQGTLGGLAGSLGGPIGLISGLLAGVAGAWYASMDQTAEEIEQRVRDMYADMLESGLDYLSDQKVAEGIAAIFEDAGEGAISLDDARRYAEQLGMSVQDVAAAFAGSGRAQAEFNAKLREAEERLANMAEITGQAEGILGVDVSEEWLALNSAINDARDRMSQLNDEFRQARDRAHEARSATERWTNTFAEQEAAAARAADQAEQISRRYRDLASQTYYGPRVRVQPDPTELDRELAKPRTIKVGIAARPGTQVVI